MTALILGNSKAIAEAVYSYPCASSVQVGEFVYIDSSGTIQTANVSTSAGRKVIGVVISKQSAISCKVQSAGVVKVFSGLITGAEYSVGLTGLLSLTRVTGAGRYVVHAGTALSSTDLLIEYRTPVRLT